MEKIYPNLTITKVPNTFLGFFNNLFLIVILGISSISFAQTNDCGISNNEIIGNTTCSPISYTIPGKNFSDSSAPVGCNISSVVDGWFYFTTGSYVSSINITTTDNSSNPNHNTGIAIYTGSGTCNNLTPVACSYENNRTPALSTTVLPNTTYKLRIMRVGNNANKDMKGTICIVYKYTCPTTAGTLSGNQYICRYNPNNTTTFSSTVSGGTWSSSNSSVANINASTGVITAGNSGIATITYTVGGGACTTYTSTRTVYVANGPASGPISLNGSNNQCANTTTTYTITPDPYSSSYTWVYQGSGATITPAADGLSATVTFNATATSGNLVVQSTNGCGNGGGGKSIYVNITPIPSIPSANNAYSPKCDGFTAQWGYSNNATSYILDVALDNAFTIIVPAYYNYNVGNNLSLTLSGLNPATTYHYRVKANNSCGTSNYSSTMSYSTSPIPSSVPTMTQVTFSNCNAVNLFWNQVTNATGYYLDVSTTSNFSSFVSQNIQIGYYPSGGYYLGGLTTGTTYYFRVRAYNNCQTTSNSNIISFSLGSIAGTTSSNQSICSGSNPSDITLSGHSGSIQWQSSTNNSTFTNISGATSNTLTSSQIGTVTSTKYFRAVVKYSYCNTVFSNTVTVSINPQSSIPTLQSIKQPDCISTKGDIVLNNLPSSGTLIQTGTISNSYIITGTTMTISNLDIGSYRFRSYNGTCESNDSALIEILAPTPNVWKGSWSKGTPTKSQEVIFDSDYSSSGDIDMCSCKVNSGVTVTVNSGNTLKITNGLTVENSANLIFENNASLVQINDVQNAGNITYRRTANNIKGSDYVYWSSPVTNQALNSIYTSPVQGPKYSWNTLLNNGNGANGNSSQGNYVNANGAIMATGTGYLVRGSSSFGMAATNINSTFIGKPNNGKIAITVYRGNYEGSGYTGANGTLITNIDDNYNLIGNPYPSAFNALKFLNDNKDVINGKVQLWKHGIAPGPNNGSTINNPFYGTYSNNYSASDYVTINNTGTSTPDFSFNIKSGQGFFVEMLDGPQGSDIVNFNNSQRTDESGNPYTNDAFFKNANQQNINFDDLERHRIWLDIRDSNNITEVTLVGYIEGATMNDDSSYDATANSLTMGIYSMLNNKSFVIQGRSLPFNDNDQVAIGFNVPSNGNYSIGINTVDGLFLGTQNIYLKDELLNVYHDLKSAPYAFTATAGVHNDRFKIVYKSATVLSNQTFNEKRNPNCKKQQHHQHRFRKRNYR